MKTFKQFMAESKLAARKGESELVHHTASASFNKFKPMAHLGTANAARARAVTKLYGSYKNINNPHPVNHYVGRIKLGKTMTIQDTGADHEYDILDALVRKKHAKQSHVDNFKKKNFGYKDYPARVAKFVRSKGVHTIKYKNEYEDPGSTSYIITHPKQVRLIRKKKNALINLQRGADSLNPNEGNLIVKYPKKIFHKIKEDFGGET